MRRRNKNVSTFWGGQKPPRKLLGDPYFRASTCLKKLGPGGWNLRAVRCLNVNWKSPFHAEPRQLWKKPSASSRRAAAERKESSPIRNADKRFYCSRLRGSAGRIECVRCSSGKGRSRGLASFLSLARPGKQKARTRRTRTEAPRSAWDTDTAGRARVGRGPSGCVSVGKKFAVSCATFRLR